MFTCFWIIPQGRAQYTFATCRPPADDGAMGSWYFLKEAVLLQFHCAITLASGSPTYLVDILGAQAHPIVDAHQLTRRVVLVHGRSL